MNFQHDLYPFTGCYRNVNGHRLHMLDEGRGDTLLMLHGNPTWGFLYRNVAAALLGEPLRLVMPDLIGLGFSDKPGAEAHQLDRHGEWMGRLIDELALEDLVFVGQDWGGPIGLRALAERPARATAMVILNTVVGPPRPGFKATAFHRFARMPVLSTFAFRILGVPQVALWPAQGDRSTMRGEVGRAYRYPLRSRRTNVAPLALARMVPDSLEHSTIAPLQRCHDYVASFKGPIEIVWGEKDPVLGSVIKHLEQLLPQARVTRTQAGHFLQEEVSDEIAAAVRRVAQT